MKKAKFILCSPLPFSIYSTSIVVSTQKFGISLHTSSLVCFHRLLILALFAAVASLRSFVG